MSKTELVKISDCSLLMAEDHYDLSFREKIELCRLVDKLGVSFIDLCPVRQKKIDYLLIKSICSAVKNAGVSVPVDIIDPESVHSIWASLKEAVHPRLQVAAPVSSVQMEYLFHLKPDSMLHHVENTIAECRKLTDEVEFIARDATRSDSSFLIRVLSAAIKAGATTITLCDTAGTMMPEEVSSWIDQLKEDLPELKNVVLGFFCSGELNMADACAFSSIHSGIREIKAAICGRMTISIPNILRILDIKGQSVGVITKVGSEQIHRIAGQVELLCHSSARNKTFSEEHTEDDDILLSSHDSMEAVIHAAEKLGYDLNVEDQQKVWKYFCQTVEKKEHITLRELDAIIAAEAMQVPPAYHDIRYVISTSNQMGAMAQMKLMFHNQEIEGTASGDGAIDAAFNSVEQATGRHFELDDFQIRSITEGREAMGETVVRLRWEGKLYSGRGISTDIVGAGIMAYINAVNKIVYEEEEA